MLEIGQIIDGKYKILNVIGKGGMSVVYLAMNERANKQWAIKEVRKDGTQDFNVVRQGLVAEIDMLKRFNHPNLPSIVDVIDGNGSFLIVMDYIEGIALDKKLQEEGALPQSSVIEWSKQLCDVLGYLHSRKPPIIYRDMKPANVMLKPDNTITLIDFGTAREFKLSSVEDTTVLGTRGYAAPEQYGGQGQTDPRTDIYCLGATMYHLVTGYNPAVPPYEMVPIRQINELLSSGLEAIILKCTRPNPPDRYQSCAELMYALEHYQELDAESQHVQNMKWRSFIAAASLSVLTLIGGIGFNVAKNMQSNNTYDKYLSDMTRAADAQAYELCQSAINLKPEEYKAYDQLLDLMTSDGQITDDENIKIIKCINHIDQLQKENPKEYALFCYDYGRALFLSYKKNGAEIGGVDAANEALGWFKNADTNQLQLASESMKGERDDAASLVNKKTILEKLAKFTAGTKAEGDTAAVSVQENWESYIDLFNNYNLIQTEKTNVVLMIYNKFVIDVTANNKAYIALYGSETVMEKLTYVETQLDTVQDLLTANDEKQLQSIANIRENIAFAKNQIASNATEGGTVQ